MIERTIKPFGITSFGKEVDLINLRNSNGMEIDFLSYGAIVKDILIPYQGKKTNVVLGYNDLASYERGSSFIGSFVGRYANRIGSSSFDLDGKHYEIPANEGKNHLHGSFCTKVYDYSFEGSSLVFKCESPDGEEGFPGNLCVKITYTLSDDNSLSIDYVANTDSPTVINLTNHSYFNLNGDGGTILNHTLTLDSGFFTPIDCESIPTGEVRSVDNTPMDFRRGKRIGDDIGSDYDQMVLGNGFDHNFVLDSDASVRKVLTLKADKTRIAMDCLTDQCAVQVYSGNFLSLDRGGKFPKNGAVCFETQHYPDSPNKPQFPSTVLRPGEVFESTTIYRFRLVP